jgi:hypothetical protein
VARSHRVAGADCVVSGLRRSLHPCSCRDLKVSVCGLWYMASLAVARFIHACFTQSSFFHVRGLLRLALRLPRLSLLRLSSEARFLLVDRYGGEDCRTASSGLRWDEVALAMLLLDTLTSEAEALTGASNGGMSGETVPGLSLWSWRPPAVVANVEHVKRILVGPLLASISEGKTDQQCLCFSMRHRLDI